MANADRYWYNQDTCGPMGYHVATMGIRIFKTAKSRFRYCGFGSVGCEGSTIGPLRPAKPFVDRLAMASGPTKTRNCSGNHEVLSR